MMTLKHCPPLNLVLHLLASAFFAGDLAAATQIHETDAEFIGQGDLNSDGRQDIVLVDKASGRIRPGYQQSNGTYRWIEWRESGLSGVTGVSLGRLFDVKTDALALASADGSQLTAVDVSSPTTPVKPVEIPFMLLGPKTVVAVDLGGTDNTALHDLFVGSIYNSPVEHMASFLRNRDGSFESFAEVALPGIPSHGRRIVLKDGIDGMLGIVIETAVGASFRVQAFPAGNPVNVTSFAGLPAGADYAVGNIRGSALRDFLFFVPGESLFSHRPLVEPTEGRFQFGPPLEHDLGKPITAVTLLPGEVRDRLLIIHDAGVEAGIYTYDGTSAPSLVQTLTSETNQTFSGAVGTDVGFFIFLREGEEGPSTRYRSYESAAGQFTEGIFGRLPTLADNDSLTIPGIHARITARHTARSEADMQPYTNVIPGTTITYAMIPIPGGQFVMGSPDSEPGRNPDEGPQHTVHLSPFWIGQFEVTWDEFELFIYPDEEQRMRKLNPTDEEGDALADAVTHPSKPYSDMTFGMGRDGYPAIAMTQHGAGKYCQWLSAKTGHFYRLPTEAEWEYACRAGTTTPYFFGDNETALDDYGWYEMNSDFKYQKVGRKKPNPWGLYDVYGNVVEWVLDQYDPDFYSTRAAEGLVSNPWNKATRPYPHSVRGGSWDDPVSSCRSAARRGSDSAWKMRDPQLPKSTWYFTDAQFVGFRLVRPWEVPTPEAMQAYWNSGVERD